MNINEILSHPSIKMWIGIIISGVIGGFLAQMESSPKIIHKRRKKDISQKINGDKET